VDERGCHGSSHSHISVNPRRRAYSGDWGEGVPDGVRQEGMEKNGRLVSRVSVPHST